MPKKSGESLEQRLNSALVGAQAIIKNPEQRDSGMVERLILALELFIANRLGVVFKIPIVKYAPDSSEWQAFFSQRIDNLSLSDKTKKYCRERGVVYYGEVARLWRFQTSHAPAIKELFDFANELGFSPAELVRGTWLPPYWEDPRWRGMLNTPLIELSEMFTEYHYRGYHYLGALFGKVRRWRAELKSLQAIFRVFPSWDLHAAMILPPDWQLPEKVPIAWIKKRAERKERREKNKNRIEKEKNSCLRQNQ